MAKEIEHRFLVDPRQLPRGLPAGDRIRQGFLSLEPVVRVRLRTSGKTGKTAATLTIKGQGLRVRAEYEYPLPLADGRKLLKLCGGRVLDKTRMVVGPWELDRFRGRHAGLWLAECELPDARAKLPDPLPPWVGEEVTTDPRYTNARLVLLEQWPPGPAFFKMPRKKRS